MMEHATALDESLPGTHTGGVDPGFFERERNRLIQDISKGVESVLGNANVLNRKIEESISVGKEFHPISELWSKFERIMVASGIGNLYPNAPAPTSGGAAAGVTTTSSGEGGAAAIGANGGVNGGGNGGAGGNGVNGSSGGDDDEGIRFETTSQALPPGVAPGGGRIYAA